MTLRAVLSEASAALRFNRARSLLTMLSLAWGVFCFVILFAYGEGFGLATRKAFAAVGQDLIVVFPGHTSSQAGGERAGRKIQLEIADADLVRDIPSVAAAAAEIMLYENQVTYGVRQQVMTARGVEPAYGQVRNMTMLSGRWFSAEDDLSKERVAILGSKAAEKLLGELPPVGEIITIRGLRFRVIGLLRTKTQVANYNTPDNECIFIPYRTAGLLKDIHYPDDIAWMPSNPTFRPEAVRAVRATLAKAHRYPASDERAVQVIIFNDFLRMIDVLEWSLRILLGIIGALTLAIGGLGLANIMLVAVTQRTREVGVMKALGATRREVLAQFLAEAMAIVTAGGVGGLLLSFAITRLLPTLPLLGAMFGASGGDGDIHLQISIPAAVVSALVLESIGLIAGLLPALRASRLDPIEALRYE